MLHSMCFTSMQFQTLLRCNMELSNPEQADSNICDALRDLVPFVQLNALLWVFFTFFKLHKWYQIAQNITYFKL